MSIERRVHGTRRFDVRFAVEDIGRLAGILLVDSLEGQTREGRVWSGFIVKGSLAAPAVGDKIERTRVATPIRFMTCLSFVA